ncbi:MAG: hypothetical protein EXS38_03430 [Opitutus sp.]|nr:hypothetical protein [Opitutus sp.]
MNSADSTALASLRAPLALIVCLAGVLRIGSLPAGAAETPALRVAFTGQALIEHDIRTVHQEKFASIRNALSGHDVVFTDLEAAIDTGRGKKTRDSQFFHSTKPEVVDCLKEWNFNLLALSNNHAWDLGAEGIMGTIEEVAKRGFVHAGSGSNLAAASAPAYLVTPRGRVALISMASGLSNGKEAAATASRAGIRGDEQRLQHRAAVCARQQWHQPWQLRSARPGLLC